MRITDGPAGTPVLFYEVGLKMKLTQTDAVKARVRC